MLMFRPVNITLTQMLTFAPAFYSSRAQQIFIWNTVMSLLFYSVTIFLIHGVDF